MRGSRRPARRTLGLAVVLVLSPGRAEAHAFTAGQGAYELFLEGASLPFHTPALALAVLALGLLIGLWDSDGLPIVWPSLAAGSLVGLLVPFALVRDASLALYALALALSLLAVLHLAYSRTAMRALAALAGGTIAYGTLALHGLDGLAVMVVVGAFAGLHFAVAALAGLAALPQRRFAASWPVIGLRVVGSWLAAITVMMLAFAVR